MHLFVVKFGPACEKGDVAFDIKVKVHVVCKVGEGVFKSEDWRKQFDVLPEDESLGFGRVNLKALKCGVLVLRNEIELEDVLDYLHLVGYTYSNQNTIQIISFMNNHRYTGALSRHFLLYDLHHLVKLYMLR